MRLSGPPLLKAGFLLCTQLLKNGLHQEAAGSCKLFAIVGQHRLATCGARIAVLALKNVYCIFQDNPMGQCKCAGRSWGGFGSSHVLFLDIVNGNVSLFACAL